MANDNEKQKADLDKLGRLVDRYAQSRALGLLLLMVLIVIGTFLMVMLMELVLWKPAWWLLGVVMLLMAGVCIGGLWLIVQMFPRCERRLYSKEGQIELEQKKVSIWAFVAYVVGFLGPVALNAAEIMPIRWALPLTLVSLGIFTFYASGKEKNRPLGVVFCVVLLLEAAVTVAGIPTPFASKVWLYSCFVALMIYIAGASLIAAVVVHIYNRGILQKIKEVRPFGEQQAGKPDT